MLPEGVTIDNVYLTLLALRLFRNVYEDREEELSLIVKKAVTWLKSIGLLDHEEFIRAFSLKTLFPLAREITPEIAASPEWKDFK